MPRTAITNDSRTAKRSPVWRRSALLLAVPLLISVLAACQSNAGLSSDDAAAIKDQIQQVASRLDAVEERLIDLSQSSSDAPALLISEVRAVTSDVGAAKSILNDVSTQLEVSVPDTALDEAIDQTDDFMDDTLPGLQNDLDTRDPLDPMLDRDAPVDDSLRDTDAPIIDTLPGLNSTPEDGNASPLDTEQP
ncbi:MAG TPA: hypothetical protein VFN03_04605 [Trueperaceae bacterium]|nr:hypothetical protein [Trueperaceae bacterium]